MPGSTIRVKLRPVNEARSACTRNVTKCGLARGEGCPGEPRQPPRRPHYGGDWVLAAARVPEPAEPTLAAGESWRDVREVAADVDALAARGMACERLDQLALEYLYGVR